MTELTALTTLVSLGGIIVVLFWFWRAYRVDRYRYDLFMLRDKLFDVALNGTLSFSDPAYRDMRQRLNGTILMADRVHWLVVFMYPLSMSKEARKVRTTVSPSEYPNLSEDARTALRSIQAENHVLMLLHLLYSSPFFLITLLPSLSFVGSIIATQLAGEKFTAWVRVAVRSFDRFLRPIDDAASRIRLTDSSAVI